MEVVQEYLNRRIISLVKKITSIEEERRVILREVKTAKNAANNSGAGGAVFGEICGNLESFLENVVVNVQENGSYGTRKTKKRQPIERKCRYFNRGF